MMHTYFLFAFCLLVPLVSCRPESDALISDSKNTSISDLNNTSISDSNNTSISDSNNTLVIKNMLVIDSNSPDFSKSKPTLLFSDLQYLTFISTSWSNCGSSYDQVKINYIHITQTQKFLFKVEGSAYVKENVNSPVKLELQLQKRIPIIGWITVPCVGGIGSCTYDDVCSHTPFGKISCPINKGTYAETTWVDLRNAPIPDWLKSGDYKLTAKFYSHSKSLLCVHIETELGLL